MRTMIFMCVLFTKENNCIVKENPTINVNVTKLKQHSTMLTQFDSGGLDRNNLSCSVVKFLTAYLKFQR